MIAFISFIWWLHFIISLFTLLLLLLQVFWYYFHCFLRCLSFHAITTPFLLFIDAISLYYLRRLLFFATWILYLHGAIFRLQAFSGYIMILIDIFISYYCFHYACWYFITIYYQPLAIRWLYFSSLYIFILRWYFAIIALRRYHEGCRRCLLLSLPMTLCIHYNISHSHFIYFSLFSHCHITLMFIDIILFHYTFIKYYAQFTLLLLLITKWYYIIFFSSRHLHYSLQASHFLIPTSLRLPPPPLITPPHHSSPSSPSFPTVWWFHFASLYLYFFLSLFSYFFIILYFDFFFQYFHISPFSLSSRHTFLRFSSSSLRLITISSSSHFLLSSLEIFSLRHYFIDIFADAIFHYIDAITMYILYAMSWLFWWLAPHTAITTPAMSRQRYAFLFSCRICHFVYAFAFIRAFDDCALLTIALVVIFIFRLFLLLFIYFNISLHIIFIFMITHLLRPFHFIYWLSCLSFHSCFFISLFSLLITHYYCLSGWFDIYASGALLLPRYTFSLTFSLHDITYVIDIFYCCFFHT